jgi:hypothetical protein
MNENDDDPVMRLYHEGVAQGWDEQKLQRALVEAVFEQAVARQREQNQGGQAVIDQGHGKEVERGQGNVARPMNSPKGVHYTELPEAKPGQPLAEEWNTYRREIGRWLADGTEGRHILIRGREIIGFFETFDAARETGLRRFPGETLFVHPVRTEEPYLRVRGLNFPWPNSLSR